MNRHIQFLGANQVVTGSRTVVQVSNSRILIDCGLYQGPREIRERNRSTETGLSRINAVLLTHAHIDHSGYLPKLVKDGYRGPIYCTEGTFELCKILLPDSAFLQAEDAHFANKSGHSRHETALPIYNLEDVETTLSLFQILPLDQWSKVLPDVDVRLLRSGHILGSSFVQLSIQGEHSPHLMTFSGDIGNGRSKVIKGPVLIPESDSLILESTYGDRRQSRRDPSESLKHIINKVIGRGGTLVIPAFAVGRTQEILHSIGELEESGEIPKIPVFLDSPMAITATELYMRLSNDIKWNLRDGLIEPPRFPTDFHQTKTAEDSMILCMDDSPKIVVSAAGMLSGGRVLHHLKQKLPERKNGVAIVGYQATGTKGLLLKNGLFEISIHHQSVSVEAEVFVLDGLSAHGDSEDIIDWLSHFSKKPKKIFLNHGEENAQRALQYMIRSYFDSEVIIPTYQEKFSF